MMLPHGASWAMPEELRALLAYAVTSEPERLVDARRTESAQRLGEHPTPERAGRPLVAGRRFRPLLSEGRGVGRPLPTPFRHCRLRGTAASAVSSILGFVPAAAQVSRGTIGGPFKQQEADGDITL